jgi:hypothetical protein
VLGLAESGLQPPLLLLLLLLLRGACHLPLGRQVDV